MFRSSNGLVGKCICWTELFVFRFLALLLSSSLVRVPNSCGEIARRLSYSLSLFLDFTSIDLNVAGILRPTATWTPEAILDPDPTAAYLLSLFFYFNFGMSSFEPELT